MRKEMLGDEADIESFSKSSLELVSGAYNFELRAEVHGTGQTFTIPSDAEADDLAVVFDYNIQRRNNVTLLPTGWTEIYLYEELNKHYHVYAKKLVSGDVGATITGGSSNSNLYLKKALFIFKGPISTFTAGGLVTEVEDGTPTGITCNVASGTEPLVLFGACSCDGQEAILPAFSTESPAFENITGYFTEGPYGDVDNRDHGYQIGYTVYPETGDAVNHSINMVDSGSPNVLISFYIEVTV